MKNKLLQYSGVILFVFLMNGVIIPQNASWKFAGNMPVGLYGSEAVVIDSLVYVMGGYSDSLQKVVDWVYKYNPATNVWTYAGKMKKPRRNFASAKIGNKIYYAGGEVYNLFLANGTIEVYDCVTNTASIIDSNVRFNKINTSGAMVDSVFYIFGGDAYSSGHGAPMYAVNYNLKTRVFSYTLSPWGNFDFPDNQAVVSVNNNIYIFGGSRYSVSRDIYRFNTMNKTFTKLNIQLGRPSASGEAIYLPDSNKILYTGGFNEGSASLNQTEQFTIIDTNNLQPVQLPSLFQRRRDFMTVYTGEKILVLGGRNNAEHNWQMVRSIEVYTKPTGKEEEAGLPGGFELKQNYPNPFNPSTVISYRIAERGTVTFKVYDIMGNECFNYPDIEVEAGSYNIKFDGRNLSSGIYFYTLIFNGESRNYSSTKKMMLLK